MATPLPCPRPPLQGDVAHELALSAATGSAIDYLWDMIFAGTPCSCEPDRVCPLCRCQHALRLAQQELPRAHKVHDLPAAALARRARRQGHPSLVDVGELVLMPDDPPEGGS